MRPSFISGGGKGGCADGTRRAALIAGAVTMSTDDKKNDDGLKSTGSSKPKQQSADTSDQLGQQEASGVLDRGDSSAQINE